MAYKDEGNSDYGMSRIGDVSGTSIDSFGAEIAFNSASCNYARLASFADPNFIVAYRDHAHSSYGTVVYATVDYTTDDFVPQILIT